MLPYDRHREIRTVLAAVFLGKREAIVPRPVGAPTHLGQQILPLMAGQPTSFEIGPRPFAPMVEKANIVVFPFERLDFALDEFVKFSKVRGNFGGDFEIQRRLSCSNLLESLWSHRSPLARRSSIA